MGKKLILRRERVQQLIRSMEKQPEFDSFTEAYETLVGVFDRIEMSAAENNRQVNDGSQEMIHMVVSVPLEHPTLQGIRYSLMTKHFLVFSERGAIALYRKIPGESYTDITKYRDNPLSPPLLHKSGACGKNVWGEQITQHA